MKFLKLLLICTFLFAIPSASYASVKYDYIQITVNDKVITNNGIELRSYELAKARRSSLPPAQAMAKFRQKAIDLLIEETLLDIKADELGILVGDDELDGEIERFMNQRKINRLEFEELLERQQVNLSDFRKTYRRQVRRNKLVVRAIRSKIQIDEAALRTEYENDSAHEKLIRARHILLLLDKGAGESKVEQTRMKALELRERIVSGEAFDEIAFQHSEDPSAKSNKGDLGFFKKTDMVEAFSEAAFSLEAGVISQPVRSSFGFHLIEVLESKKQSKKSFDSVRNTIMQQRYQKEYETRYVQYIQQLRENAIIIIK
jgi:peptidyl-prolyl cis-trans isomerase SurA